MSGSEHCHWRTQTPQSPRLIGWPISDSLLLRLTPSDLAASITAAVFRDAPQIALANVIGSNIANIGLILGVAALIAPLRTTTPLLRREVPFMILVSILLIVTVSQGLLIRSTGFFFVGLLGTYLWYLLKVGNEEPVPEEPAPESEAPVPAPTIGYSALRIVVGIALLTIGARILVDGAIGAAEMLGISQRIIGLTLVAIGTSLPELATVIVAAIRRESDLILGNLIGSNIFNILCILGITLIIRPLEISFAEIGLDMLVMLGFAVSLWPLLQFRMRIGPKRGATLLLTYGFYISLLFL